MRGRETAKGASLELGVYAMSLSKTAVFDRGHCSGGILRKSSPLELCLTSPRGRSWSLPWDQEE